MTQNIGIYVLFPALAFISCLSLYIKLLTRQSNRASLLLFANMTLMNLALVVLQLLLPHSPIIAEYMADAYLIFTYFFFAHLVFFALNLSAKPLKAIQYQILYAFPVLLTLFHLSGFMIESYRFDHNSLMHNDGMLAWCFDVYAVVSCFATVSFLFQNLRQCKDDRILISKNIIAILSCIPLVLVAFIIVLLSRSDHPVPVVILGSSITLYTAVTFFYLSRDKVADVSIGIAFFFARLKLAYQLLETDKTKMDSKQFNKQLERQFIKEALVAADGNIQAAADYMQVNHTTLRNKIKEYDISVEKASAKESVIS